MECLWVDVKCPYIEKYSMCFGCPILDEFYKENDDVLLSSVSGSPE